MTTTKARRHFVTGFCNPSNDDDSHRRCPEVLCGLPCDCQRPGCHNAPAPTPAPVEATAPDPLELLRAAAKRLRELAGAAPWRFRYLGSTGDALADQVTYMDDDCERSITVSAPGEAARIMAHIAAVSPRSVALALAALLVDMSQIHDPSPEADYLCSTCGTTSFPYPCQTVESALAVARAVLEADARG